MKKKELEKVLYLLVRSGKAKTREYENELQFKTETGVLVKLSDNGLTVEKGKTVFICEYDDVKFFYSPSQHLSVLVIKNDKVKSKLYLNRVH